MDFELLQSTDSIGLYCMQSVCLDSVFKCRSKPVGKERKYTRLADTEFGTTVMENSLAFSFYGQDRAEQSSDFGVDWTG